MGLCSDSKYNCGEIIPSACVPYTGPTLLFLDAELTCDANINDVFKEIDKDLKKLKDGNNLTKLEKDGVEFDPLTITIAGLHQVEINEISLLKGRTLSLEQQLTDLDVGDEIVTIDLPDCLDELASPCATGTNQYQLKAILNVIASKLCNHESRITNLE